MAYEPTVWKSGDVITSTKLNKLENGVADAGGGTGGGVLICHINEDTMSLDKTWNEIKSAASTSVVIALSGDEYETNIGILKSVGIDTDEDDNPIYVAAISNLEGYLARYVATSADGYPVLSMG